MNTQALQTLADHLRWLVDNDKRHKFDMSRWLGHPKMWGLAPNLITTYEDYLRQYGVTEPISPYECGTTACLAGFLVLLHPTEFATFRHEYEISYEYEPVISKRARAIGGLPVNDATTLFGSRCFWEVEDLYEVTIEDALTVLDYMIENNELPKSLSHAKGGTKADA